MTGKPVPHLDTSQVSTLTKETSPTTRYSLRAQKLNPKHPQSYFFQSCWDDSFRDIQYQHLLQKGVTQVLLMLISVSNFDLYQRLTHLVHCWYKLSRSTWITNTSGNAMQTKSQAKKKKKGLHHFRCSSSSLKARIANQKHRRHWQTQLSQLGWSWSPSVFHLRLI